MAENELHFVPRQVLTEILSVIHNVGCDDLLKRFDTHDSVLLDTEKSETWIIVGSQSDIGSDGGWGSCARIEIECDNGCYEFDVSQNVADCDFSSAQRQSLVGLIDAIRDALERLD